MLKLGFYHFKDLSGRNAVEIFCTFSPSRISFHFISPHFFLAHWNGGAWQGHLQVIIIGAGALSYLWCAAMHIHSNRVRSLCPYPLKLRGPLRLLHLQPATWQFTSHQLMKLVCIIALALRFHFLKHTSEPKLKLQLLQIIIVNLFAWGFSYTYKKLENCFG